MENYGAEAVTVTLSGANGKGYENAEAYECAGSQEKGKPAEYQDMETGERICDVVRVKGFGIRILKRKISRYNK